MPARARIYVAGVIVTGLAVLALARVEHATNNLLLLLVLVVATLAAELVQLDLYGQSSISVTAAIIFAAGLTTGLIGLSLVSLACALGSAIAVFRTSGRRSEPYKVVFNWASHVLAAAPLVFALDWLRIPVQIEAFGALALLTAGFGAAYYLVETGLVAGAIALSTGQRPLLVWRERYRWLLGHYLLLCGLGLFLTIANQSYGLLGVIVFATPIVAMRYAQKQYIDKTTASVRELERLNRELSQANGELSDASDAISHLNDELFDTLARFFDARDPYVGEHAATVARYASAIGRELGVEPARLKVVRQAALLHDIGKIAIPESILHKPGRLTDAEFQIIQAHPQVGADLLGQTQGLRHLARFVLYHHERWDGRGYPEQLAAEEIPLESRIISLCDAVEAMASDRPYRKGLPPAEVLREAQRCAGTQFDPEVVRVFARLLEREGEAFIVNSARELVRKHADGDAPPEGVAAQVFMLHEPSPYATP